VILFILNVHSPAEDICNNTKGSFYVELERVFIQFPEYHRQSEPKVCLILAILMVLE